MEKGGEEGVGLSDDGLCSLRCNARLSLALSPQRHHRRDEDNPRTVRVHGFR